MNERELDPPVATVGRGLVLDVDGLCVEDPAAPVVLRCTDGTRLRVPAGLYQWAVTLIARNHQHRGAGHPSLFPRRIEFGTHEGAMYAREL